MLPALTLALLSLGGPPPTACDAAIDAPVVARNLGVATVVALDGCARYLIRAGEETVVVSPEVLRATVRAPMDVHEAELVLAVLREPGVVAGAGTEGLFSDRSLELLNDGIGFEQAVFLRELYAVPEPSDAQRDAISHYEALLFGEVQVVLGAQTEIVVAR